MSVDPYGLVIEIVVPREPEHLVLDTSVEGLEKARVNHHSLFEAVATTVELLHAQRAPHGPQPTQSASPAPEDYGEVAGGG